ncbi:type VI secretion system ATPase TssH, partial [Klebsiella pneumoniae]
ERLHPVLDAQSDERLEVQQVESLRPSLSTRNDDLSGDMGVSGNNGLSDALRNALDKFTLDVTARARDGKIDPVFGRDNEIRQMVDILSRRR